MRRTIRSYNKTPEISSTCANCKDTHPVNYSQCPALLAFLAKKTISKERTQHVQNSLSNIYLQAQSFPHLIPNKISTISSLTRAYNKARQGISYARAVSPQSPLQSQQTSLNLKLSDQIDDIKATDIS